MVNDNKNTDVTVITDEIKNQNSRHTLSKFEYDLYHEEDDIAFPVFRIKRIGVSGKSEKWKIFSDNKVLFIIESNKLNKKESEFLQTVDGFNFILNHVKAGFNSFNKFRAELKKTLSPTRTKITAVLKKRKEKKQIKNNKKK